MDAPKTNAMRAIAEDAGGRRQRLVLLADRNDAVERSIRNLANARVLRASYLNIRDLLRTTG